jgi:hypothetical protein
VLLAQDDVFRLQGYVYLKNTQFYEMYFVKYTAAAIFYISAARGRFWRGILWASLEIYFASLEKVCIFFNPKKWQYCHKFGM